MKFAEHNPVAPLVRRPAGNFRDSPRTHACGGPRLVASPPMALSGDIYVHFSVTGHCCCTAVMFFDPLLSCAARNCCSANWPLPAIPPVVVFLFDGRRTATRDPGRAIANRFSCPSIRSNAQTAITGCGSVIRRLDGGLHATARFYQCGWWCGGRLAAWRAGSTGWKAPSHRSAVARGKC